MGKAFQLSKEHLLETQVQVALDWSRPSEPRRVRAAGSRALVRLGWRQGSARGAPRTLGKW